jgi:glycosyltransferase involved in cell wall biosynthesis
MKVYYISPSTIPSRSANSIHVINMCEALVQLGYKVVLFARFNNFTKTEYKEVIVHYYGVNSDGIELNTYSSKIARGAELFISMFSLLKFITDCIKGLSPQVIIARNLYAALLFGVILRRGVIYETHSPEYGFRKKVQGWLLNSPKIRTVVISNALKKLICEFHSIIGEHIYVFHDAAREGALQLSHLQRKRKREKLLGSKIELEKYNKFVGYFGHLYYGRGIEIIQGIAKENSEEAFVVYGGDENEIKQYRNSNSIKNIFFMGHISPNLVNGAMGMMDILLMPYQNFVSLSLEGVDTAKWMSPMKMFEYLSVGIPIISSDLPVLREVLEDGDNAILVKPDDVVEWSDALQKIVNDTNLADNLGMNAYNQYRIKYTWKHRAEGMLSIFNKKN